MKDFTRGRKVKEEERGFKDHTKYLLCGGTIGRIPSTSFANKIGKTGGIFMDWC